MAIPSSSHAAHASVPLGLWTPQEGDRFIVDTAENIGYLVHEDGTYTSFEVVTGQRRTVHYIGRTYNATTPTRLWIAKTTHIKGDRLTFGKRGLFIRLFHEDGTHTSYGIHGYGREDEMFSRDTRFQSMGCIIVREHILSIIERTFELNGESMEVITVYGLQDLNKYKDRIAFARTHL